jgi:FKBP-type peptidyl-prolyl cis-trans isomerase (trigger factor)
MNIKQNAYIIESTPGHETKHTPAEHPLSFKLLSINSQLCIATVTIPHTTVDLFYTLAAENQSKIISVAGFQKGHVPLDYIKKNYQETLNGHVQEILFKFYAINFLYKQVREQKLIIAGEPRLIEASLLPEKDAAFLFEVNLLPDYQIQEWKHFPFKAPKRKRYKDLDKQVQGFIDAETEASQTEGFEKIAPDDWVFFSVLLATETHTPIASWIPQQFWFHIGKEETESDLREIFLGRTVGETYITTNKGLQEYFSSHIHTSYAFLITIEAKVAAAATDFELIKRHFKLKTNKALHQKLVEVFSYRNDVSQRRSMAQDALKMILAKHPITPPVPMVLRKQEELLHTIKNNPDYNVYRTEKKFTSYLTQLAEKQCKEEIVADLIAANENIEITNDDVQSYLNLYKRPRTKEFLYFRIPSFTIQNQEVPAPSHEIMHYCLREKTLNYIIYHLTKD